MAACLVEDARRTTPIYCPITDPMERAASPSSAETSASSSTAFADSHRCSLTFPTNNKRKRPASFNETDSATDNSCQFPAASINESNEPPTTPTRPSTLFLLNTTAPRSLSILRTCASHPQTSPSFHGESSLSPMKFTSLLDLSSPQAKRRRPDTLLFTPTSPLRSTVTRLISPTELAEKLKANASLVVFDCGSPFRHSEHRIRNAILLRVADKLSRKRWKSHGKEQSNINSKQLNESAFIVLYDDHSHTLDRLSPAFECACEEIRRCQTNNHLTPILILNCSFDQFLDLYPNLCESLQPRSCPSSPMNHRAQSSSPHTAPLVSHSSVQATITTNQIEIDRHPMTHIIDGLFIGSESNAKDRDELAAEQIRCIVNVTSHVPLYHSEQFQYCHLPADDTQKQNLLDYFDRAYTFIRTAIENNERVLVHCVAGISRSPAIVIGFLMRHAKMSMNDAYEFVKRKRTIVSPNLNFMGQLLEYEKILKQCK